MSDDKLDLDWLEDLSAEPPIIPQESSRRHGQSKKIKYNGTGWKYYLTIKPRLPEWWEEFNGKTNESGPFYRNIWSFIKAKTKNSKERDWLYEMFGPSPDKHEKREVPWLADWNKRRKNGYWNTEDGYDYRRLAKVLKNNVEANEAVKAAAPFIIQELMRYSKIQTKIEEVFNGKPFNDNKAALSPSNRARFKTYFKMLSLVTDKKIKLMHEWMRVNGINPDNPHELHDMATLAMMSGRVGASAALTGVVAGQSLLQPQDQGVTRDAMLMALQLQQHKGIWKKELPPVEGKVIIPVNKPNGKHSTQ